MPLCRQQELAHSPVQHQALFSQHSLYNSQSPCAAEAVRFGDECESNAECVQVATVLLVCPHIPDDFGPFAEIVAAFDEGCAQVQRQAWRLAVRSSNGVKFSLRDVLWHHRTATPAPAAYRLIV